MKSQVMLAILSASTALAQQAIYEQCGGKLWTGGTDCASGTTCQLQNPYYSQCLPGSSGGQQTPPSNPPPSNQPPSNPAPANPPAASPSSGGSSEGASSAPAPAASNPPATGGTGGAVNTGACGAYSGDKTGYASTTHYYDGQEGACGCGTGGSMASWQAGDGSTIFTAAGSQNLFGGSGSWCGSGCGQCYELTNVGYIAAEGMGDCTGAGNKITVMITNLCPADGNEQWCSQPADEYGYGAHFDILSQNGPAGWNNPIVSYKSVACPGSLTSDFASCQCASGATSRARRGLMGTDNFYPVF